MLHRLLLCLALGLSAVPQAASASTATSTATVEIGGALVRLPVPEGYVRLSERSPALLAFQQGMLPESNRLVESLLTEPHLADMLAGKDSSRIAYQVQTMRQLETTPIRAADWPMLRKATMEQIGGLDMGKVLDTVERQANRTLDGATGGDVGIRLGDPAQPALYATDDADAVHFSVILPVELEVAGEKSQGRIAAACVMIVAAERLVLLYAFQNVEDAESEATVRARVQAAADALAAAARRANAAQEAPDAQAPEVRGPARVGKREDAGRAG